MATQPSRFEANRLYWETDSSVAEIAEQLGVSRRALYELLDPAAADGPCPGCGEPLLFANRLARAAGDAVCHGCGRVIHLAAPRRAVEAREVPALRAPTARSRHPAVENGVPDHAPGVPEEPLATGVEALETPAASDVAEALEGVPWTSSPAGRRPDRTLRLAGVAILGIAAGLIVATIVRRRGR